MNKSKIKEIKKIYSKGIAVKNNTSIPTLKKSKTSDTFFNNVINKLNITSN